LERVPKGHESSGGVQSAKGTNSEEIRKNAPCRKTSMCGGKVGGGERNLKYQNRKKR